MFNRLFQKDKVKQPRSFAVTSATGSMSERLKTLIPFANASEASNITALTFAELIELRSGDRLFEVGLNDEWDYYLLEGELALIASDGRETLLDATSPKAKNPLAYLRPRKFASVVRSRQATVARFPHHVLELIFKQAKDSHSWGQEEAVFIGHVHQESLLERVIAEIERGTLVLPTLPEVAEKVRRACQDSDNSTAAITKIVAHDTSISAKLLAASNSPLYRGASPTNTLQDAIARLGRTITQQLVFYYATKELFETHIPLLRQLFQASWQRSLERAVLAQTLAQHCSAKLNPDTAFLCGLLFRLGDLVVYQYAADFVENTDELAKIQQIAETTSVQISRHLIKDWNLPQEVSEALEHGMHWLYTSDEVAPDYGELMVVTNIHLRILHNSMSGLPDLNQVPAIKRILTEDFAPDVSIIAEAKKALAEFVKL